MDEFSYRTDALDVLKGSSLMQYIPCLLYTSFKRTDNGSTVFLKSGKAIPADMVLLSIGVRPATALAHQAGLKLGEMGGIWVDEHLETSEKDIYACLLYTSTVAKSACCSLRFAASVVFPHISRAAS